MKKAIFVLLIPLLILNFIMSKTLKCYTAAIKASENGVYAKRFVFLRSGSESYSAYIKIAPTESDEWQFVICNYGDGSICATDLYYELLFNFSPRGKENVISELKLTVNDSAGNALDSITGAGTLHITGFFPIDKGKQIYTCKAKISWPSNDKEDLRYAGSQTTFNVTATASDIPADEGRTLTEI
ncbi:MAG: hypothetical protein Q8878_10300 [Bacillota bacterium]|nr:hypothetical protein [Bacillota bacterium]